MLLGRPLTYKAAGLDARQKSCKLAGILHLGETDWS